MKRAVFSFDDGRLDTYTVAYPILKKYEMPFTVNVVTDFVSRQEKYTNFVSGNNQSMTAEQLLELERQGMELACHGHTHQNTEQDILENISALSDMGIVTERIGFASPNSEITEKNGADVKALLQSGTLGYIRSGIQVKREGLLYAILTVIERRTHSARLFWLLNRRNVMKQLPKEILPSVAITRYTTNRQMLYLLDRLCDGESVIFMFHSVLHKEDTGYGADDWFFDAERFDALCENIYRKKEILVCTTRDLIKAKENDGVSHCSADA